MARPKLPKFTQADLDTIQMMLDGLSEFVSIKGISIKPDGSLAYSGPGLKIDSDFLYYWAKDDASGDAVFWKTGFTSIKAGFLQLAAVPYTLFGTPQERALFFMDKLNTWVTVGDPDDGNQAEKSIQAALAFLPPVLTKGLHIYGYHLTRFTPDTPKFVFDRISLQDTQLVTLKYLPKGADAIIIPPSLLSFEGVTDGLKLIEGVPPTLEANFMPLWWLKPLPQIQWKHNLQTSEHVEVFRKYWGATDTPLGLRRSRCGKEMVAKRLIKPKDLLVR